MTDSTSPTETHNEEPAPEAAEAALPPPPPPPARPRVSIVPIVYVLGAVVLGLAVLFLWYLPRAPSQTPGQAEQLAALSRRVDTLEGEVKQLASRPPGDPGRLAALSQQVAALASRPAPAAPDLKPIEERLSALEQHQQPDLASLQQQLQDLKQQVQQSGGSGGEQIAQVTARMDAIARQQQQLAADLQAVKAAEGDAQSLSQRLDAQQQAIQSLQGSVQKVGETAAKAAAEARIQAALAALQEGKPLGAIPNAPPSVSRFASAAPPTLGGLRRSFEEAAASALAAGRQQGQGVPFFDRVWNRAQDLVTVRQGDRVIVGDPDSAAIAKARADLDRGDLAGAVQALSALSGTAAQHFAPWLQSARALLDARAALLGMAGSA